MAGKTFRGVGEDDDDRPRLIDEDESRGLHSGPTVVDDQKVAEVLKKLRSLDKPPGPLTGVTEVVVDANSSEPTRIDSQEIQLDSGPAPAPALKVAGAAPTETDPGPARLEDVMYPLKRATSIGRSLSTPADGQPVTVPADLARGTLFGRSIHLPDVNAPESAEVELSSGAVQFLDGAPPALQPFPLADRPAVVVPPPTSLPAARFHTPYDVDQHTQLVDPPRSRAFKRFVAFVGGLSIAGLGVWAWWQYGGGHASSSSTAPAVAAPVAAAPGTTPGTTPGTPPSIDPIPPAAAPAAVKGAPAATGAPPAAEPAASAPTPAAAPAPAAVAPTPTRPEKVVPAAAALADEPNPPAPAPGSGRARAKRAAHARHAGKPAPSADEAEETPASNPGRSHKRGAVLEDPDATMGPSE